MVRKPEPTRPSPRDSAGLCLQTALVLLAIWMATRAGNAALAWSLIQHETPPDSSYGDLLYIEALVLPPLTAAVLLLVCSASISRALLGRVGTERESTEAYLVAAMSLLGIHSITEVLASAEFVFFVMLPTWPLERGPAALVPHLALGVLLLLFGPLLARLWRARMRVTPTPVPAAPAN